MGIEKCKPKTGNERVDIGDIVDLFEFPKGSWTSMRFLDHDPLSVANHWIDIVTKIGEKKRFPKICVSWDAKTEDDKDGVTCPYCKAGMNRVVTYYINAIIRDIQEDEPAKRAKLKDSERKTQKKEKGSKSWTPVRVVRLTSTLVARIQGLSDLNVHKVKGEKVPKPVSDNKYGMDVSIKYDEKATSAANKYTINTGDKTELQDDELEYLVYDLEDDKLLKILGQESVEQAKLEIKRLNANTNNNKDDDDDDDYDMSKSKKRRSHDDDDDDEDDEPKSKKKKRSFDDDDEDEDYEPKSKKKKRSFDDDEDDEKPKKKKKRSFDDEDEDDEPKSKKKKRSFDDDDEDDEKPKKKKKRSFDDDDEDDDY